METSAAEIIEQLRAQSSKNPLDVAEKRMVPVETVIGVSTSDIRALAKKTAKDRSLAEELWSSQFVEAKALAILLLPPKLIDKALIETWVTELNDWSTCDLFVKAIVARRADALDWGVKWASNPRLYTKRAGLALIANYCMRAETFADDVSTLILDTIRQSAPDDRDHVRQASCWALREFGKSNTDSHEKACIFALELIDSGHAEMAWVGRCAYRELEDLIKVPERRRLISRKSKTGMKYAD
ncbi:MAG: DNA alkylation repair protein [Hyphomonas sp.]|nr:DNA alkylation repair protein [Hyphomonas sp.]